MNNWMTVKVRYTKQLDNGSFKRVTEPYVLAAMSFTDAEARIYEELGSIIRGEFTVVSITRTEFHDIFHYEDADVWYKSVISYGTEDEDTGKTKKVKNTFLVTASSVAEATERTKESLSGMMVDFNIDAVSITPIVDLFPYNEESLDKEISRFAPEPKDYEVTEELVDDLPQ